MSSIRETVISDFSDATYIENFRLFEDGTLVKRNGCIYLARFDKPIRGILHDSDKRIYIVSGNDLWYYENGVLLYFMYIDGAVFSNDTEKCRMFIFAGILYIFGGGIIFTVHVGDTNVYFEVNPGYVPTLASTSSLYSAEGFNLLRNRVRECFSTDTSNLYKLAVAVNKILSVKINGVALSSNEYTCTSSGGKYVITITNAVHIVSGKILEVEYSVAERKYTIEHEHFLMSNRSFVFEGEDEKYLMLYSTELGCVYYSKLRKDETGAVIYGDYFPYENKFLINGGLGRIRGIVNFSGRVVAVTQSGIYNIVRENGTFRAVLIDNQFGASAKSGVQVFENEMYFMNSLGLYRVTYNPVEYKYTKRRIEIPDGMKLSLEELDSATLHIDHIHREIWCIMADKIAVYSLECQKWYRFTGFHPESCIISDNYTLFISGSALCKFDPYTNTDFGSGFEASFQTGNIDFGNIFTKKTVYEFGISFERGQGAVLDCTLTSDTGDTFSFSVNSDLERGEASPIVKRTHARMSQCKYITCRVTSKKSDIPANVRSLMLRYRMID